MAERKFSRGEPSELVAAGGDACTLAIVEDSMVRWRLRLIAHLTGGGSRVLGTVHTCPSAISGAPQSRVVAAASLPGVARWSVRAECLDSDARSVGPTIALELVAANGLAQPSFRDFELRRTAILAGDAGTVELTSGQRVVSVAAMADAVDATITINGGAPIPVPPGRAVRFTLEQVYGAALVFAGTSQYLVEVEG